MPCNRSHIAPRHATLHAILHHLLIKCADRVCAVVQVKAELNYSDLLAVPDMVCSTAFDRDDEFFATAGVYRRVKIFDFASVQENDTSIHYPVLEIPSRLVPFLVLHNAAFWPSCIHT